MASVADCDDDGTSRPCSEPTCWELPISFGSETPNPRPTKTIRMESLNPLHPSSSEVVAPTPMVDNESKKKPTPEWRAEPEGKKDVDEDDDLVKPSELEIDSVGSYGTINCFIILKRGIVLGVDSRGTDPSINFSEAWKDVCIWRADDIVKYKEIQLADNRIAIITFAGSKSRIKRMLREVGKNSIDDFDQLFTSVCNFFTDNPLNDEDKIKACQVYLAGYSVSSEALTVHHVGDLLVNYEVYTSNSHPHFGAIGSGAPIGLKILNSCSINPRMPYMEAISCITDSLREASVLDPRCGGDLRVFRLTEEGKCVKDLQVRHCIDSILKDKYLFEPNSLFLFSSENTDDMNYGVLYQCFRRILVSSPRRDDYPLCLGSVRDGWNMFVVTFQSEQYCNEFLKKGTIKGGFKKCIRGLTVTSEKKRHELLISSAEHNILHDIRVSGFQEESELASQKFGSRRKLK